MAEWVFEEQDIGVLYRCACGKMTTQLARHPETAHKRGWEAPAAHVVPVCEDCKATFIEKHRS